MLSSTIVKTSSKVIVNYQQYLYPILINSYHLLNHSSSSSSSSSGSHNNNINIKNHYTTLIKLESNSNKFKNEFKKNLKIINNNNNNKNNNITKFFNNNNTNNKVMKHFYSNTSINYNKLNNNIKQQNESVGFSLLPVINKLQENASLIGSEITLPQIVVIGSQSSGKTSVLESLVGRDFLPRGSGLVTRRPLVLQLNQTENNSLKNDEDGDDNGQLEEWGEFGHTGSLKFNFNEIKDEIERETERVAGPSKDISPEPIVLRIYSPKVIPLTLVDLPGLTRVAIEDQPPDIEEKIKSMIIQHISNPNSIILAISPANQDIVTSDALKLAQQVDPMGKRTIGVLTKLDLMDKGTDALDILLGNAIPLNLGFVGVVNRSQQDILNHKPITNMLADEKKWFDQHPVYNRISNQLGTNYLAQKCNKILTRHIRDTFPTVKNQIRHLIKKYETELEKYGDSIPSRSSEKSRLLLDILNKFSQQYKSDLEGTNDELVLNSFNGGARIRYIFQQAFDTTTKKNNNGTGEAPFDWLSDQQLKVALRNASGLRSTMFIPQKTFDSLIRKQIERIKQPMIQSSELVLDELLRILTQADYSHVLSRFPVLKERIVEVSNNSLRKLLKPCNQMISDLVDAEASFINTTHPNYLSQLNNDLFTTSSSSFIQPPSSSSSSSSSYNNNNYNNQNSYNDALNPYNIDRSYPIDNQIKQQQQQSSQQQAQQQQQQSSGFLSRIFGGGSSSSSSTQSSQQQPKQNVQIKQQQQQQQQQQDQYQQSNLKQYGGGLNDITEEERRQINLLRRLLMVYYTDIAQFNIQQNTMKVISLLLIDKSKETIQKELISNLYDQSLVDQLLRENDLVVAKRNECIYKLELLKKAKKSLSLAENNDLPLHLY